MRRKTSVVCCGGNGFVVDLRSERIEKLRDPFRVIRPRLCRHEIVVSCDLVYPRTSRGFDFWPDDRVGRHRIALADYRDVTEREYEQPTGFDVEKERAREVLRQSVEREMDHLSVEAMDLLDAYGVPTPAGGLAESAEEAEAIAQDLGGPVVMKIVSPDILHKSGDRCPGNQRTRQQPTRCCA